MSKRTFLIATLVVLDWVAVCTGNICFPCIRLRGGSEYDSLDPQLRAEILEDAYRMQHGNLPRFLENLGEYDDGFGQYRCL
jgi:hypothetical protein